MLTAFTHLYLSLAQVMVLGHRLQPDCCPSIGVRHLGGQLQLARGRGLCRSRRLQRHPVLGVPGPARGLQPHSVFHPQTQGDTPPPFRSASPSQSPTEKGLIWLLGSLVDSWRSPGCTHSREAAKATGQAGGHWERRRRAAPAGEATVMPGDARPAQGQKPRRPALTRGPAQSAKHTHRTRDSGPCNAGRGECAR